jgi:hypothetical protein
MQGIGFELKEDKENTKGAGYGLKDKQERKEYAKLFDEIDKIVDQEYNGHYVVPTKPNEVDTSAVSEYIAKVRKEREGNGR